MGPTVQNPRVRAQLQRVGRLARRHLPGRRGGEPGPARWTTVAPVDRDRYFDLAVCTMFKDEAEDLVEWIEFHRLVGVQKFLLYDNNSTDGSRAVLAPYVASGLVTVHDFPPWPAQLLCYNSCVETYRDHARWLAFIDVDEFLYPAEGDALLPVLAGYDPYPAVAVNWLMFSTSGHILRPPGLVIENYTRCQVEGNRHVKLIVNPKMVDAFETSHSARYVGGAKAVNELEAEVDGPFSIPPSLGRLRLNHYWTKSVEDFLGRRAARGEVDNVSDRRGISGLLMAERVYATGEDRQILRFLPQLQRAAGDGSGGPP